jgi:hypothetical protein
MSCPFLSFGNINFEATNQKFLTFGNIYYEATREWFKLVKIWFLSSIIILLVNFI